MNTASENIGNYRATSLCDHCLQDSIMTGNRPGIMITVLCFLLLKSQSWTKYLGQTLVFMLKDLLVLTKISFRRGQGDEHWVISL